MASPVDEASSLEPAAATGGATAARTEELDRPAAERIDRERLLAVRRSLHELFTPLSVVVGFTDLLREGGGTEEERRRHAQLVHDAGRELEQKLRRTLAEVQGVLDRHSGTQLDLI